MKYNKLLLLLLVGIPLFLAGCTNKNERQIRSLESIVEDVESNGKSYTFEDWENIYQEYDEITEYLVESSDKLTSEQNREVGRLHARFHKAVVKNKMNGISERINAMGEQIIGYGEELLGNNVD